MRHAGKAAGQRDLDHAHFGLHQQVARAFQPDFHVIALGRAAQIAGEKPFELARRHSGLGGQPRRADRILDIGLHPRHHLRQTRMAGADADRDRHALVVILGADRGMDHLVGDPAGKVAAMIARDLAQHHVDGGGAAGGGQAAAIFDENRADQRHIGKFLGKAVLVFPMDGGAAPGQQPGLGQHPGTGAKRAHARPAPRLAPEPAQNRAAGRARHIDAAADQNRVAALAFQQIAVERQAGAVRTADRGAAGSDQPPVVERPARKPVRQPQGLDRGGKGNHRKPVQQQEKIALRSVEGRARRGDRIGGRIGGDCWSEVWHVGRASWGRGRSAGYGATRKAFPSRQDALYGDHG